MKIAYNNNFDDYNITVSSENANYPASNAQDSRLSRVWRTTSLTSQTAAIDAGAGNTLNPTFAALLSHNFSTGATVKIQGSSSSGFSSSTEANLTRVNTDFIGCCISLSAKRYWRFLIKDTGSTSSYMEAGRLWISNYITIANSVDKDFSEEHIDTSQSAFSYTGQQYGDEGILRRAYSLTFPLFNSTDKAAFDTFEASVKGFKNFITIFDSSNPTKIPPVYGVKVDNITWNHKYKYQWGNKMTIEEVK